MTNKKIFFSGRTTMKLNFFSQKKKKMTGKRPKEKAYEPLRIRGAGGY